MEGFRRFLIYPNTEKDSELEITYTLDKLLRKHGAEDVVCVFEESDFENGIICEELMEGIQCVIVLGGDGTMLRAAHVTTGYDVFMIGVNLGTLGFLTEIDEDHMEEMAERLISGDFKVEDRIMMQGDILSGEHAGINMQALNDIVLVRAGILRVIAFHIYVNGALLDTYEADGVIVSTPTGSTGYNLSAGGPIVNPGANTFVVTPIAPHSLSKKSVVFSAGDVISIEILEKRKTQENEAIISCDGYENYELAVGDKVDIRISDRKIHFIRMYDTNFYEVLKVKIGGNQ